MAEGHHEAVHAAWPIDALLLAYLSTDDSREDELTAGDKDVAHGAQTAGVSDLLSGLADDVAGAEVGADAEAAVVEATAQAVLPFTRHFWGEELTWRCEVVNWEENL